MAGDLIHYELSLSVYAQQSAIYWPCLVLALVFLSAFFKSLFSGNCYENHGTRIIDKCKFIGWLARQKCDSAGRDWGRVAPPCWPGLGTPPPLWIHSTITTCATTQQLRLSIHIKKLFRERRFKLNNVSVKRSNRLNLSLDGGVLHRRRDCWKLPMNWRTCWISWPGRSHHTAWPRALKSDSIALKPRAAVKSVWLMWVQSITTGSTARPCSSPSLHFNYGMVKKLRL